MTPRDYLNEYIGRHGSIGAAAEHLGIAYSTLAGICNGSRGVGRKLAQRMTAADPLLDANRLVWIRPTKPAPAPAQQGEAA